MKIYVHGIGVLGPGLNGWQEASDIFSHKKSYSRQELALQSSDILPPNERRRCSKMTLAAIQVAKEAMDWSNVPYDSVATVYSSSEGSVDSIDIICESIAKKDYPVSPMRFQNSVFNATPGYWAIATKTNNPSTSICCFDDSFSAGFLEAVVQVEIEKRMVLLISADQRLPDLMHSKRPISDSFACAILLGPYGISNNPVLQIDFNTNNSLATQMENNQLESLRKGIPAARSLPLFEAIASRQVREVTLTTSTVSRINLKIENW